MFHIFANLSLSLLPVLSVVVVQLFSSVFSWVLTVVVQVLVLNKTIQIHGLKYIKRFVRRNMTNRKTGCWYHIKIILGSPWFSKILSQIYFSWASYIRACSTMMGDSVKVYIVLKVDQAHIKYHTAY